MILEVGFGGIVPLRYWSATRVDQGEKGEGRLVGSGGLGGQKEQNLMNKKWGSGMVRVEMEKALKWSQVISRCSMVGIPLGITEFQSHWPCVQPEV